MPEAEVKEYSLKLNQNTCSQICKESNIIQKTSPNRVGMEPNWLQNSSKMAPWQPLGASWAPEGILDRFGHPFWLPFWPPFWAQLGREPFPISLFRLLRPPRALQEALQRLSEGLRVEDAIWNKFWTGFGSDSGDPGPLKIRFPCQTY